MESATRSARRARRPAPQAGPAQDVEALFAPFWETWDVLHQVYVDAEQLDDAALMEGALQGMLEAVGDPNTAYMNPDAFRMSNEALEGSFEGDRGVCAQGRRHGRAADRLRDPDLAGRGGGHPVR
ncbi:MAG: hypothetical protein M5R40_17575 [Anaerolineae bacterium]|nr:hypothetical protein [Anaerolineae bacterium]